MGFLSQLISDIFGKETRPPNAYMWNGEEKPFYNRWWLKINSPGGDSYSIQATINNPWDKDRKYKHTGVYIFFDRYSDVQGKNLMTMTDWPLEEFKANEDRFEVEISNNKFSEKKFQGSIHDDHHNKQISFDLNIEKVNSFVLSELGLDGISRSSFTNTLWQAPLADCRVTGSVTIDDERVEFKSAPGYQDTFWGKSVPDRWFWGQCNSFKEDSKTSFVIAAGQLEIFGIKVPRFLDSESFPILAMLHHKGHKYVFNSLLNQANYHFDKGHIRLDIRNFLQGTRIVYKSDFDRGGVRPMDWHSPDDTILESGMALMATANLKVYKKSLFGPWKLEAVLTSDIGGAICGGAKMDRISKCLPLLRNVFGTLLMMLYVGAFFVRGIFKKG